MKQYGVLMLLTAVIVSLLPLMVLSKTDAKPVSETVDPSEYVSVLHADGKTVSNISRYDLTLYSVMGTVAAQVSDEVIKAQTVAVYSLIEYQQMHRSADAAADVTSTALPFPEGYTASYWKAQWGDEYDRLNTFYRTVVDEVFGQKLRYQNAPVMALYHTMNGGKTEYAQTVLGEALPYLRSVASPADALDERQLTTVTIPASQAATTLKTLCHTEHIGGASTWFSDVQKSDAGTVLSLCVGETTLTGAQLQEAFSLPSASFEVCVQEGQVIFTVRGNGHFVGMSLCGAEGMAQSGSTYREILAHYYPDTVLSND